MKKLWLLITIILTVFTVSACNMPNEREDVPRDEVISYLNIYYVNDLHGAILPSYRSIGMASIGNLLVSQKEAAPEQTLILAGGDMLQGGALSNITYGEAVIELMNATYFDAFALGNHEFDWGLDKVMRYFDPSSAYYTAEFSMLGANVIDIRTETTPDFVEPYSIVERGQLTIGIIGAMGYGLESSIHPQHIENYRFDPPVPIVESYARYLRNEKDADVVLLLTHDPGETRNFQNLNEGVAAFDEDAKVDVVFNAHSHQVFTKNIDGLAAIQSGGYGSHVGLVQLSLDDTTVTNITMSNLDKTNEPLLNVPHPRIQSIVDRYVLETDDYLNTPIITAGEPLQRDALSLWLSTLMLETTNADIALQNRGGTRSDIPGGTEITMSVLYDVWPFDNTVKTGYLRGDVIESFLHNVGWSTYVTTIEPFEADTYYKVATNDFVFDQPHYPFVNAIDIEDTNIELLALVEAELKRQAKHYDLFYLDNPLILDKENTD